MTCLPSSFLFRENEPRLKSELAGVLLFAFRPLLPPPFVLPLKSLTTVPPLLHTDQRATLYPPLRFHHNVHIQSPYFNILVALELRQRQDGPTLFVS